MLRFEDEMLILTVKSIEKNKHSHNIYDHVCLGLSATSGGASDEL